MIYSRDRSSTDTGTIGLDLSLDNPPTQVLSDILQAGREGFERQRSLRRADSGLRSESAVTFHSDRSEGKSDGKVEDASAALRPHLSFEERKLSASNIKDSMARARSEPQLNTLAESADHDIERKPFHYT